MMGDSVPIVPVLGTVGEGSSIDYEELTAEIKKIVEEGPRRTSNQLYYSMVVRFGREYMDKKHWGQRVVYATIRKMRKDGLIDWNAVIVE
jgi:endonuclease III-like uncharacterized protein